MCCYGLCGDLSRKLSVYFSEPVEIDNLFPSEFDEQSNSSMDLYYQIPKIIERVWAERSSINPIYYGSFPNSFQKIGKQSCVQITDKKLITQFYKLPDQAKCFPITLSCSEDESQMEETKLVWGNIKGRLVFNVKEKISIRNKIQSGHFRICGYEVWVNQQAFAQLSKVQKVAIFEIKKGLNDKFGHFSGYSQLE